MPTNPPDPHEAQRLASLASHAILDTPPEAAYDEVTALAALICDVPIATVGLVDRHRLWLKSARGLHGVRELPRRDAFCDVTIGDDAPLCVPDATRDPRFAGHRLATHARQLRFYYGVPLRDRVGYRLGTLAVMDRQPRTLDARQCRDLAQLAALVESLLANRRHWLVHESLGARFEDDADPLYMVAHPSLDIVAANRRARDTAWHDSPGLPVSGTPLFDRVRWHGAERLRAQIGRPPDGDARQFEFETEEETTDGVWRPVAIQCQHHTLQGASMCTIRVADRRERRASESRAREARERWRFVTGALDLGVLDWHLGAGTAHVSSPARQLLGWAPGADAITRDAWLAAIHPGDRAAVIEAQRRHLDGAEDGYEMTYRLASRPGERIRERGRVVGRLDDGRPARLIALLDEARADGQATPPPAAPETRGADPVVAATRTHGVRGPLRPVGRVLQDLADTLPALPAARRPRVEPAAGTVRMRELFESAWRDLQQTCSDRQVDLHVEELPLARGDADLLRQAVDALLSNALARTQDRTVAEIRVSGAPDPSDAAMACYRVHDNGAGLPPQAAKALARPRQRAHAGDDGHGPGLAPVRAVVARHGGSVRALPPGDGVGAVLEFTLPLARQETPCR